MAEMMQFNLVSPERMLLSAQASSVQIPGADGDMTAMASHAPTITTLRPGLLTVETDKGEEQFIVTGGFAEIGNGISILAEKALPRDDMDQATYEALVSEAQAVYSQTKDAKGAIDDAAKLLNDMAAIGPSLGLTAVQPTL